MRGSQLLEHQAVGLQHVGELSGVLPPAADHLRLDPLPALDQAVDRLGDLQLAAPGGLQGACRIEDRWTEEVDPDQRQVGGRVLRLLDQPNDAVAVQLGDAVGARVVDLREQDQRVGLRLAKGGHEAGDPLREQVVAQVHDEGRVAEEVLGGEHRVREAGRPVLGDVGDRGAERGAVAGRLADLIAGLGRDHDADLGHARLDQRLDPVEEHGLVGDRHQLLRRGMRDRAQPRSRAAREDEAFQVCPSNGLQGYPPASRGRSLSVAASTRAGRSLAAKSPANAPQLRDRALRRAAARHPPR